MLKRKLRAIIFFLILMFFMNVVAWHGAFGKKPSNRIEALIDLLKQEGTVSEHEAVNFKIEFIKSQYSKDHSERSTPETNGFSSDPAAAGRPEVDQMPVKQVPAENAPDDVQADEEISEPVSETLAIEEPMPSPTDYEALKQEIRRLEEKLDRMRDQLLQRDRIAEREREEISKKVYDDLAQKTYNASWAQRIKFGGDIRLRYQGNLYDDANAELLNPSDPTKLLNTTNDRHRFRYRARVDIKAKLVDSREINVGKVEAGLRLSTGNEDDPISTNDTFGDYMNKDELVIDRAYLKWTYQPLEPVWGLLPELTVTGGRIANPWVSTNLVWDSDLNFEGLALNLKSDTQPSSRWNSYLTLGVFSIQEEKFSNRDKWLYGAQVGVEYRPIDELKGNISVAYYDYENIEGIVNDPDIPGEYDFTAPIFQQKGNTLIDIDPSSDIKTALAADYNLVNLTARAEYSGFYPINVSLIGDVVYNIGFDQDDVERRTGIEFIPEDVFGYQIGMQLGYPEIREFGEWNTSMFYRYLEADAVLDAFTDSDFHDGGTNTKGWIVGFEFGLYKDVWLTWKWLSSDEAAGPPVAIDVMQLDLNARF